MFRFFTLAIVVSVIPVSQNIAPADLGLADHAEAPAYIFPYKNSVTANLRPDDLFKRAFEPEKKTAEPWGPNWMATAQENIRQSEYHFKWEEKLNAYCTPNRKNNLRFFYTEKGFTVEPRTTQIPMGNVDPKARPDEIKYKNIPNWKVKFSLDEKQVGKGVWGITGNKAEYVTDKITVQYINNDEGMRQNFIVHAPLSKKNELKINFSINTKLKTTLHNNQLKFTHKKAGHVLNYAGLKVWDADNKILEAGFVKNGGNDYAIKVNTANAVYPITIDPLSTGTAGTPDWVGDDADQADAYFGVSIASAGDVNGDGYSDVIIGADAYDDGANGLEGRAFVYHGSAAGLSATPNSTPDDADQANVYFGVSVASAGDVNGDGYSDVIIGAYGYVDGANANEGRAFVYHGSATVLSATPNSTPDDADQAGAEFGVSVASAGDVNGDGYSDVIIGAPFYNDGVNNDEGRAYVYHGSATGLGASPNSTPDDANQADAYFGYSVASAGDVNGDGYSDVIIGAYFYNDGANTDEGRAFVYHGSATGLSATPDSTPDDADQAGAMFGISVASAGDVNGDGYSDVIIGAHGYNDGANNDEGRAFVYHGSAAGLSATPNSTPDDADQANVYFGVSVASAGDVNGDGYSDVIIGAYGYNDGANTDEGRAFVYHGSAAGLSATPNSTPDDADQADARFGFSVASAGDVNGDGYSDVIIGAYLYNDGVNTDEGRAFVYHGSAAGLSATPNSTPDDADQANVYFGISVASAGDVNGDGYSDVIIGAYGYNDGANTDEGRAFVYHGSATGLGASPNSTPDDADQASAQFGISVASAGDVNGDGYSDVIIGAYLYNDGANTDEGRAFVYHGSATGLSATPNSTPDDADQAFARFGISIASAGDVNGDGYSDVIIGAYFYDDGANTDEGWAFVYHGGAAGLSATPNSTPDDADQADARLGYSVASAGDVNGDGYSDVIIGAYFYDDGANTNEGRAFVYHGSATGLGASPNSTPDDADQAGAYFGISIASAGDVNGDGYSDVIIGAHFYNDGANTDEGRAYTYNGNDSTNNKRNNLRLYNTDLTTPLNSSNFLFGNFGAGLYARSFLGRDSGKIVWETRLNYNAYSGTPITNSTFFTSQQTGYTDLGLAGVELKSLVDKLLGGRYTKLRVRVKYKNTKAITGQVYGPWRNVSSIIDANNLGILPIELISFNAAWIQKGKTARLDFKTDKESGVCCFDIEKSADGFNFYSIGTLPAKNTSGIQSYSFMDANATAKKQLYRIKIKGMAGQTDYSNIQQLQNDKATEILVFPNPTTDVLQLQLNKAYDNMHVRIFNASGQLVKQLVVPTSNRVITIPVQHLAAGKYWLLLQSGGEKQVLQFVKQ